MQEFYCMQYNMLLYRPNTLLISLKNLYFSTNRLENAYLFCQLFLLAFLIFFFNDEPGLDGFRDSLSRNTICVIKIYKALITTNAQQILRYVTQSRFFNLVKQKAIANRCIQ